MPEPAAGRLRDTCSRLRLGADPAEAWDVPGLEPLARVLVRAQTTGAPPTSALVSFAAENRAERLHAAGRMARRTGVLATAPLGLCFLPAFVLVGVTPVVVGLADGLLDLTG
ncbi:hypothetical protein FHU37_002560 [Allostreptomyces psammosilenae]|uniref:Type II secretion system protein GspF domain-containing protein n=1 Tax=Allostreptomyces psammosilenae TaxID=1892865 RepID=A0A852ZVF5_9ACTN|nr:hypothetical protein [Allostreptomyces psammosilenae]